MTARSVRLLCSVLLCLSLAAAPPARAQPLSVTLLVQAQAEQSATPGLLAFYRQRDFAPAWRYADGPSPQAHALARLLAASADEGLPPAAYHAEEIARLLAEGDADPAAVARLDVLLTDAFLTYGAHLLRGRADPHALHDGWSLPAREADLGALLGAALRAGSLEAALAGLRPRHRPYARLRQTLAAYRRLADEGGWPTLSDGPTLETESRGERVGALRLRLRRSGDLAAPTDTAAADRFDAALEAAVRAFQQRHGLEADGRVGRATLAALNVPVEARIRHLERNLERWRWLPDDLGAHHVFVNLAACRLEVVEEGQVVLQRRIIRGTPRNPTPVFSAQLTEVVLAPVWNVPRSIAVGEILPALRRDAAYLARHSMTLFEGSRAVDPGSIDWAQVSAQGFPYRIRQASGPGNTLGRIKFVLTNPFGVGLHDTNQRYLFQRTGCAFSHGCLRLENPLDLAVYALRGDTTWTAQRLNAAIDRWVETAVALPSPSPLYVLYFTAWVDEHGTLHFRDDGYPYDARLDEALDPAPAQAGR